MTVVFTILKFIGILILCLVAILLLLLCIVLFVPIRYKIEAGTRQLDYNAKIKIHWMLFFVRFYAVFQNQAMEYQLRIFGYPIMRFPVQESFHGNEKESSKEYSVKKKVIKKERITTQKDLAQSQSVEDNSDKNHLRNLKQDEKSNHLSVTKQIATTDIIKDTNVTKDTNKTEDTTKTIVTGQIVTTDTEEIAKNTDEITKDTDNKIKDTLKRNATDKKEKNDKTSNVNKETENNTNQQPKYNKRKSLSARFRKLCYQTKQLFHRIKIAFAKAKDKIKFLKRQYHKIKKQVTDERNKKAVKHIWKEVTYLLRHFKPRKIKLNCNFSTTDPALTGQITQILCVIPFFYQKDIHIIPQFQEEEYRIMADIYMQGHIRLIHLLCTAVRVLFDKNIMKWIRKKF